MNRELVLRPSNTVVGVLFATLLVEQLLDLHSTLSAAPQRTEANPFIAWIAGYLGLAAAMLLIKSLAVLVILGVARVWSMSGGRQNRWYALVLLALNGEYCAVLVNNYI